MKFFEVEPSKSNRSVDNRCGLVRGFKPPTFGGRARAPTFESFKGPPFHLCLYSLIFFFIYMCKKKLFFRVYCKKNPLF